MKYEVRIVSRAHDDFREAIQWYADNYSAEFAANWYDQFLRRLETLEVMPESHPLARENKRTDFDLRDLHFGVGRRTTHRAVFRVVDATVEILAIRHVARGDLDVENL